MKDSSAENYTSPNKSDLSINLSSQKLTALWAFSESAFGGVLHALKLPFRGIFISSAAVIFITLIAFCSKQSKTILRSTLIVLLIKALVSPQTPVTAYFAVSLQGILGYFLFATKKFFRASSILLGILTLFLSRAQKIILLTLLFGNTLWKSIDVFIREVTNLFFNTSLHSDINTGYLIAAIYLLIHLVIGTFIGIYAGNLPQRLINYSNLFSKINIDLSSTDFPKSNKKVKKIWYKRPTGIVLIIISSILIIISYLSPSYLDIKSAEIIFMLFRSFILTIIWFYIISPILRSLFTKFLSAKELIYTKELDEIISVFPRFKNIISLCWNNSAYHSGPRRIYYFLSTSFYFLLTAENT